jgi:hypothetical protein
MAGEFIEILNPGYSTLWTRDLLYTPGTGEASDLNPFDPSGDRPLVEGEWLELDGSTDGKRTKRGGDNVTTVSGTPDGEGTVPAFLYFQEEGRYDAQATRRVHIIKGPVGFEVRTKLVRSAGLSINSKLSVWDWDGPSGAFGLTRRVLSIYSAGYVIGRVTRIFGTNDISFHYLPGSA